ncbi:uncharacterized protein HD556DRAFT_1431303 [Suillus plorans]|uniref:DUF659 domain-containing protein n=1 Tax=Suillus plorans TaxID=116603 RepID=A0A9P7DJ44_9AGAM|nr:uncharacterized protein HD556DRAFT_1431303 [Suillus plorans]KAG1796726.1 hypothetical protein HD556DRAFT_1431303 [Suillus plorans]
MQISNCFKIDCLKKRQRLTLLFDGWDDKIHRSLYGSVAAEVGQYPTVLSLDELTGHRGSAEKYLETVKKALKNMEIENGRNIIALTMDDPTVMQSFRRKFKSEYHWVITLTCFLHNLNTIIGKIALYPAMKKVATKSAHIVSYFNQSHYWGGQLDNEARSMNIHRSMKSNTESRPLGRICVRPDTQKKTNNLSPVTPEVIKTVLSDPVYWPHLGQFIKTCEPIVDAIGNLESRDATLADCMLELIRCAQQMMHLQLEDGEDVSFWMHAKAVFNGEFHTMNTNIHALAIFLHPIRTFEQICTAALDIAKQWRWDGDRAIKLVENLKQYYQCKSAFTGGQANGKDWWENLLISAKTHPLKTLAITLFLIRLFSDLGGIQIRTFETLGKLHNNYSYHPVRQKHAHMHTRNNDLDANFAWTPPLASQSQVDDKLEGPESLTEDEVAAAFDEIEQRIAEFPTTIDPQLEGFEILVGHVYDLVELEQVDKCITPAAFKDDVQQVGCDLEDGVSWDVQSLLTMKGVLLM